MGGVTLSPERCGSVAVIDCIWEMSVYEGMGMRVLFRDLATILVLVFAVPASAQVVTDPVPETIAPSGVRVGLVDVAQLPQSSPTGLRAPVRYGMHAGDGSGRLFVADGRGLVYIIDDGSLSPTPFFDAAASIGSPYTDLGRNEKLGSFTFHPDYADPTADGFGRFYTVTHEAIGSSTPTFDSPRPNGSGDYLNVLSEWQVDPIDPDAIAGSRRILMSTYNVHNGHDMNQIAFDRSLDPGDEGYGLLFVGQGDGGRREFPPMPPDPYDTAQDLSVPNGSILRIDPLGTNSDNGQYGVPTSNPFATDGDADTLGEIFAYGFRNPQRFSFDPVSGKLLVGDIGESNVEEIDLLVGPGNFGWPLREGVYQTDRSDYSVVLPLPGGDSGFEYPVVQLDRDEATGSFLAISGGFVYRGSAIPELYGHYVFGELVSGRILHVSVDELEAGSLVIPSELTLMHDGVEMTLLEVVREATGDPALARTDLRFGLDESGELFVLTKRDGWVRTFAAVPEPSGLWTLGMAMIVLRRRALSSPRLLPLGRTCPTTSRRR